MLRHDPRDSENITVGRAEGLRLTERMVRRFSSLRVFAMAAAVAVAGGGAVIASDVTSSTGAVIAVFTRTTDSPFNVPAFGSANFSVPFDVNHTSTLIIKVSLMGTANSDREWGANCSGSSVTCEPFGNVEFFPAGKRNTLSFNVVARNVPKGVGTVNLNIIANCSSACGATEELTVETLVAVVEVSKD